MIGVIPQSDVCHIAVFSSHGEGRRLVSTISVFRVTNRRDRPHVRVARLADNPGCTTVVHVVERDTQEFCREVNFVQPAKKACFENEDAAICGAQKGEAWGFNVLYEMHKGFVYRRCLQLTHDRVLSEDLTQEVFLQVWKNISKFKRQASFRTWVYRVATNVVLMNYRKNKLFPRVSLDEPIPVLDRDLAFMSYRQSASRCLENRVLLSQTICQLPEGGYNVMMLHDACGYKHHEIAKMMGISSGTSKSQLYKARNKLRTLVASPITAAQADSQYSCAPDLKAA